MLILAIFAAASAWLVTRKAPQHRPLAWALTACAGLDAVRLLGLPERVDMAVCLGAPIVSGWAYGTVFDRQGWGTRWPLVWAGSAWPAFVLPGESWWWFHGLAMTYGMVVFLGGTSALTVRRWTISQRVALILLAGDALAVASLCGREWISNQAGVALAAVTVYQMAWWLRWNRGEV